MGTFFTDMYVMSVVETDLFYAILKRYHYIQEIIHGTQTGLLEAHKGPIARANGKHAHTGP